MKKGYDIQTVTHTLDTISYLLIIYEFLCKCFKNNNYFIYTGTYVERKKVQCSTCESGFRSDCYHKFLWPNYFLGSFSNVCEMLWCYFSFYSFVITGEEAVFLALSVNLKECQPRLLQPTSTLYLNGTSHSVMKVG